MFLEEYFEKYLLPCSYLNEDENSLKMLYLVYRMSNNYDNNQFVDTGEMGEDESFVVGVNDFVVTLTSSLTDAIKIAE